LTTTRKLLIGFGSLIALLVVFFVLLTIRLQSIERSLDQQANIARPRLDETRLLEIGLLKYSLEVTEFARTGAEDDRLKAAEAAAEVDGHLEEYRRLAATEKHQQLAAGFAQQWRAIRTTGDGMLLAGRVSESDIAQFEMVLLGLENYLNNEMEPAALSAYTERLQTTAGDLRGITSLLVILLFVGFIIVAATSTIVGASIVGTEAELIESEEKYRGLFDSIDQGFCIVQLIYDRGAAEAVDYRFLEVSPSFERQSGLKDAAGKTIKDLIPGTRYKTLEAFAEVAETGRSVRFENRNEFLGRWHEINAFRFGKETDRQVAVLFKDITERKNEENRLALLARFGELTRGSEDVEEYLQSVATAVGTAFGVRRCLFNEIDLDNDREIVHSDYTDGVESVRGEHKVSAYSPITSNEMKKGRTVVNHDSRKDPRTAPLYDTVYEPAGERAYVCVPLMRSGRWVASLWLSTDEPREWSEDDVRLVEGIAERAWLAVEKIRAAEAVARSRDELEQRVSERTSQLMTTLDQLRVENEQRLRAETDRTRLLDQLVGIQEDERRRIARDLHDELGQQLTALRLNLGNARAMAHGQDLTELIDATQKLAENLDADIGFLTWELRPATLDHSGLSATLAAYIREWSRFSNVKADLLVQSFDSTRLEPHVELNLYRIVQEALNNVSKYAKASTVNVLLERQDKYVSLIIEDNGGGFDAQASLTNIDGLGLVGMRERAAIIGGSLIIESTPGGGGSTIYVRVPIDAAIQPEKQLTNGRPPQPPNPDV
jgi:PAS domain S-box-containing protein